AFRGITLDQQVSTHALTGLFNRVVRKALGILPDEVHGTIGEARERTNGRELLRDFARVIKHGPTLGGEIQCQVNTESCFETLRRRKDRDEPSWFKPTRRETAIEQVEPTGEGVTFSRIVLDDLRDVIVLIGADDVAKVFKILADLQCLLKH